MRATLELIDPRRKDAWPDDTVKEMLAFIWEWTDRYAREQVGIQPIFIAFPRG